MGLPAKRLDFSKGDLLILVPVFAYHIHGSILAIVSISDGWLDHVDSGERYLLHAGVPVYILGNLYGYHSLPVVESRTFDLNSSVVCCVALFLLYLFVCF